MATPSLRSVLEAISLSLASQESSVELLRGGWACTCQPCVHAENTVGGEGEGLSGFFMQNLGKGLTLHLPVSCRRASSSGSRGYIWMALLLVP